MADDSYEPKIYIEQGAARQVIKSSGSLDIESGGELDIESGGALKLAGTAISSTADELNKIDEDNAGAEGIGLVRTAKATFDVTGGDTATEGSQDLGITIPDNAIILDGVVDVITTFEGESADDAVTIAIQVEGANDIVSAVAISDGTNPWDAGLQDIVPDGTAANMVKTTSDQNITVVIDDSDGTNGLAAGKMNIFLRYVVSD